MSDEIPFPKIEPLDFDDANRRFRLLKGELAPEDRALLVEQFLCSYSRCRSLSDFSELDLYERTVAWYMLRLTIENVGWEMMDVAIIELAKRNSDQIS